MVGDQAVGVGAECGARCLGRVLRLWLLGDLPVMVRGAGQSQAMWMLVGVGNQ